MPEAKEVKRPTTVIHGGTKVVGVVSGFTPGGETFRIDFENGCAFEVDRKAFVTDTTMDKLRVTMNTVGLNKLPGATINFTNATLSLG